MRALATLLIATATMAAIASAGCTSQLPPAEHEKTPPPPPQYQTREQADNPTIFRLENTMTPEQAAEAGLAPLPEEPEEAEDKGRDD
jgi:hypothetical protein